MSCWKEVKSKDPSIRRWVNKCTGRKVMLTTSSGRRMTQTSCPACAKEKLPIKRRIAMAFTWLINQIGKVL